MCHVEKGTADRDLMEVSGNLRAGDTTVRRATDRDPGRSADPTFSEAKALPELNNAPAVPWQILFA